MHTPTGRRRWALLLPVAILGALFVSGGLGDAVRRPTGGVIAAIGRETPELVELAASGETDAALERAGTLVEQLDPRRVLCHELYHEIGLAVGELDLGAEPLIDRAEGRVDLANPQCGAGYLHGILISKTASGEIGGTELRAICAGFADLGRRTACLHGAGHALARLVALGSESFASAGARCATIEASLGADGECAGGLAMEHYAGLAGSLLSDDCATLAPAGRARCLEVYAAELVAARVGSLLPEDRPTVREICEGLDPRLAWACAGAAGSVAANSGLSRGTDFLVERLRFTCGEELRCLAVGISEAALLQGPTVAEAFCALLAAGDDCAALIGAGLLDPAECEALVPSARERCLAGQRAGRALVESIAPPPTMGDGG